MPCSPRGAMPLALLAFLAHTPAHAVDAEAGQVLFKVQCGVCHAVVPDRNMVGPSLFGLVGRKSGEAANFRYSAANKAANLTWDAETLDRYLKAPREVVPGTTMAYAGLKDDAKRADLIGYLETLR